MAATCQSTWRLSHTLSIYSTIYSTPQILITIRFVSLFSQKFVFVILIINVIETRERERETKMQAAKEKVSNMASSAKEHVEIYKAKVEEKVSLYI